MDTPVLSALLAFVGYSLLNLGQGGQKLGIGVRKERPLAGGVVWAGATFATLISFFFVFAAILTGSVSIAGAMAGTGLVSLALFSRFVLGERLRPRSLLAIVLIITAAVLIALLDRPNEGTVRAGRLYGFLAAGIVVYVVSIIAVPEGSLRGVLIGGFSGFLGAYSQLFQRYGTTGFDFSRGLSGLIIRLASDPVTLLWLGLSGLSLVVLQFSYSRAEAIRIVPVFTANFILVPVVGGVLVFGEQLSAIQWTAVAAMVVGSAVLGRRGGGADSIESRALRS